MLSQDAAIQHRAANRSCEAVTSLGLAAVVTALHVAILARRVPLRAWDPRQASSFIWRMSANTPAVAEAITEQTPSKPTRSFAAGQLALAAGVAIITLAVWLHIMRLNGAHGP